MPGTTQAQHTRTAHTECPDRGARRPAVRFDIAGRRSRAVRRTADILLVSVLAGGALAAVPLTQASAIPLPPESALRDRIVKTAMKEHANTSRNRESSRNCNFYSGYWKPSGDAICGGKQTSGVTWRSNEWCADFSRYVWKRAGAKTKGLDPFAGSFYRAPAGKYHKKGSYTPRPGDAVLYDWDGSRPGLGGNGWDIDHVGLVKSYNRSTGKLTTIEGNTTSDRETGKEGVFTRHRDTRRVVGYVSPRLG